MTHLSAEETAELDDLHEKLIAVATHDETYRFWVVEPVSEAAENGDIDTLRVYFNLTLCPGFNPSKFRLMYAQFAIAVLRERGDGRNKAEILTPQVLHAFQTVATARQVLVQDLIKNEGLYQILLLLIERPELESIMVHLMDDRKIDDLDELIRQSLEAANNPLPLHKGLL